MIKATLVILYGANETVYFYNKGENMRIKIIILIVLISILTSQAMATSSVLAVSLGMPDQSLKQYIQQAHQLHIPIVIRGLYTNPNDKTANKMIGSFRDTELRMKKLIGKSKHGGISIDPMVFRAFHIKVVPTFVVFNSYHCIRQKGASCSKNSFDSIKGNIPLNKSLSIISQKSTSPERQSYCQTKLNLFASTGEKSRA